VSAPVNLRVAGTADAAGIARLHLETLPADLSDLTPLGERLIRHFYARAIERGVAEVRVAEENGELLGFVMVTADIGTMFPSALLAGPRDVATFLVLSSPIGLVRAAVKKFTSGTATVPSAPEIVYMGVSGRARGRGLGNILMHQGQLALDARGFREYQLNVDADNEHAIRVHLGRGFEIADRFEKGGRKYYRMVCRTSPPPPL
jgi:ribosomal protein S18 acetylase RimI-like enzyme